MDTEPKEDETKEEAEAEDTMEQEPEANEEKPEGPRMPNNTDYLAGAMLANGIIWIWMQALSLIGGLKTACYSSVMAFVIMMTMISQLNLGIVLSIAICLLAGGFLAGYMRVRKRLQRRRLELEASS